MGMKPVILMMPEDTTGLSVTYIRGEEGHRKAKNYVFTEQDIKKVLLEPKFYESEKENERREKTKIQL